MNTAQVAREKAIVRVEAGAPKIWKDQALQTVRDLAREFETFTTDEVWERIGSPIEPRAMGAVMRRAQRMGFIKPTMMVKNSTRPQCHARPLRVWKSETRT